MKVFCDREELSPLEREFAKRLHGLEIDGYGLLGYAYVHPETGQEQVIDGVLICQPGLICCVQIKEYPGVWTGELNTFWLVEEQRIEATPFNPYRELRNAIFLLQDKLAKSLFAEVSGLLVHGTVLAPDQTQIQIKNGALNKIYNSSTSVSICQVGHLGPALKTLIHTTSSWPSIAAVRERFQELSLDAIAADLIGISEADLQQKELPAIALVTETARTTGSKQIPTPQSSTSASSSLEADWEDPDPSTPDPDPASTSTSTASPAVGSTASASESSSGLPWWIWGGAGVAALGVLGVIGSLMTGGSSDPVAQSTPTPVTQSAPTEDAPPASTDTAPADLGPTTLSQDPVVIGVMTDPAAYGDLSTYLESELEQRLGESVQMELQGDRQISYQAAKNNIAQKNWDLVFAYSPMNSITARDNGYTWVARMFPQFPPYYQSVLFVQEDSPIVSLQDIDSSTTVALGEFGSASSFFMPVYSLFGKTVTLSKDHSRSSEIIERVRSGEAQVGAVAKSSLEGASGFRILQESRDIPGAGVYLSPELTEADRQILTEVLLAAPAEIQEVANYGAGSEPEYQEFRTITIKAEEVISCADLDNNPVDLFCQESEAQASAVTSDPQILEGQIKGWTMVEGQQARLTLQTDPGQIYQILVSLQTLSGVPNCTSPGACNGKRIQLQQVTPQTDDSGSQIILVSDPDQMRVL